MWNALKARLRQGYRTGKFPEKPPVLPDRFAGRAELVVEKCNGCGLCINVCPFNAISKEEE